MTDQQGRNWSRPYKKPNEINGRNTRSQLVATVKMSNDFNVATGRNTHPIYYVYRRAALGAAGTSLIAIMVGRSIIQTLKFITTFLNPSSWWKTGQRIRFVVNRVGPSIGLNVTFCSLSFLRSVIHPSLFVFRSADSDGWSQCRSILGRGRRAVGGYAFALCAFLGASKELVLTIQNILNGYSVLFVKPLQQRISSEWRLSQGRHRQIGLALHENGARFDFIKTLQSRYSIVDLCALTKAFCQKIFFKDLTVFEIRILFEDVCLSGKCENTQKQCEEFPQVEGSKSCGVARRYG